MSEVSKDSLTFFASSSSPPLPPPLVFFPQAFSNFTYFPSINNGFPSHGAFVHSLSKGDRNRAEAGLEGRENKGGMQRS